MDVRGGPAIVLFFQGKRIKDNLDAWKDICNQLINPFRKHDPVLDRKGASFIAFEALAERFGLTPTSIQLIGYCPLTLMAKDELTPEELEAIADQISDEIDPLFPGFTIHVFKILCNERFLFKVSVDRTKVEILELPMPSDSQG